MHVWGAWNKYPSFILCKASSSSSIAAFHPEWARVAHMLWVSRGILVECMAEEKEYFGLGLMIPLYDQVIIECEGCVCGGCFWWFWDCKPSWFGSMSLCGVLNDCSKNSTCKGGNTLVSSWVPSCWLPCMFEEEPVTVLETEVSNGITGRGLVHGGVNVWDSIATLWGELWGNHE